MAVPSCSADRHVLGGKRGVYETVQVSTKNGGHVPLLLPRSVVLHHLVR